jgi:GNAT superfamily N-acetyltransferase
MSLYIRPLLTQHYKSVKEIFREVFEVEGLGAKDLYHAWRHRSHDDCTGLFTRQGDLVGFAILYYTIGNPYNIYLAFIAICPSRQGENLGSRILTHCLQKAVRENRSIHLYSLDYPTLKKWYCKHGFSKSCSGKMNFHSYRTRSQASFVHLLERIKKPLIEFTSR